MSSLIDIEFLFKQYYKRLFRVAYQVVHDDIIAEDIVQEVFIHIWNKREELQITSTIEGYLVKATVNRSINYLEKSKKKHVAIEDHLELQHSISQAKGDAFDYELFQKLVYESLENLPPKCKSIFVLSRFEGMKNKEIAEHLEISIKTVENQMTIAISKLNNDLKPKIKDLFPDMIFLFTIFLNFV